MSDGDIIRLIFLPGFSTSRQVTDLSGRGVGMDSVRAAVERLGGKIEIESRWGSGTTVRLVLPFSIVMTRVLTVECGGQVFGLPVEAIVETLRVKRDIIHPIGAGSAFVFRGKTVNLSQLTSILGNDLLGGKSAEATIVVAWVGGELNGFEVEKIGTTSDVMLMPPEGLLRDVDRIAGTTILGDGRILIVLEPDALLS